ncbi:serine/threonine protein kinase [Desulfosporosinus sp. PR]|uniref:serine/threonine protein kinase n=1 Tax=Candidatus Desulfosporosinus nitrosoreducens TaxID=3401928 RepID=UPI0027FB5592|nr:serine/threonine protein kinase [Desulfosporosinus sp. PR]MDQ7092891.1 serine/threonine protein kinase [Desulfosporosinus sp. PR]
MVTKVIDKVTFELKDDFDFSFISQYGTVFAVFDKQDSGNLCFGVQYRDRKLFLKMAGASTIRSRVSNKEAIDRLKSTVIIYEDLRHPKLINLIDHKAINDGYLTIFEWFEGECMGRQYNSFDKFIALPTNEKLHIYNDILLFHQHVNKCNYVAIDFYDGCIMYDFLKGQTMICDIEFYHKKPYFNPIGRMWGSSQHMSPEEFQLGAEVDEKSNVFLMGATAFQLFGGGRDRSFEKWSANKDLFKIATKGINPDRKLRYCSIDEYINDWNSAKS